MSFAALDVAREAAMAATMAVSIASGPANEPYVGPQVAGPEVTQTAINPELLDQVQTGGNALAQQSNVTVVDPAASDGLGCLFSAMENIMHEFGEGLDNLVENNNVVNTVEVDDMALKQEEQTYTVQAQLEMQNPALSSGPSMC